MAMATLSGDDGWLRESWRPKPPRGAEDDPAGGLPAEVVTEIQDRAFELVVAWRNGELGTAQPPRPDELHRMLEVSLGPGTRLPDGIGGLLAEELGSASRYP